MKRVWIYDMENMYDFHCTVFLDRDSDEKRIFEISNFKNEFKELIAFVKTEVKNLWGYNNNQYDDVILEWMLQLTFTPTANQLFQKSQEVIDGNFWGKLPFTSADIFRMLHFNRFFVSLKWAQFMMDSESIEEMPVHWSESIIDRDVADKVIAYCVWDVIETRKVIFKHPEDLQLRRDFKQQYPHFKNPFSMSNTAMGKESMLFDYCKLTGDDPRHIKDLRTHHKSILLKDVIDESISFKTKPFQNFLQSLKNKKDNLVTKGLSEYIFFQNMHYDLKKGGLHGTQGQRYKKGKKWTVDCWRTYESTDYQTLIDYDFGSYYPGLLQKFNVHPQHLNAKVFVDLIKTYTSERLRHKKAGNKKEANALKIKINSLYGLLGDQHSFLYDLKAMYTVTINGQLILLQLIEELAIHGYQCWYANTDGVSVICPNDKVDHCKEVAYNFAKLVDIPLEDDIFKKAYIRDVNNFVIIKEKGFKLKGCYVYEDLPLNKNASNRISSKAATHKLIYGTSIQKTISEEDSILPFCIGIRAKHTPKKGMPKIVWFDANNYDKNNRMIGIEQQKTIRYIVTKSGGVLKFVYPSDNNSETYLEAHPHKNKFWYTTMLNKIESFNRRDYNIDEIYYVREAEKLCEFKPNEFQGQINQLSLF